MSDTLLTVDGLSVDFGQGEKALRAVREVSFSLKPAEILCLVGESGSGKSVTSLALMGLLPKFARVRAERIELGGRSLLNLSERAMARLRGREISMIFQDPMSSLNPALTVGFQLAEVLRLHNPLTRAEARAQALALLERVRIADARRRMDEYPHQLSGGMRQRVMIAIALACKPRLLIADEPTTALDVTVQAQILSLITELRDELGTAVLFITHDLGVVAEIADRVAVMYAGRVVEQAPVNPLFDRPSHGYTAGLLSALVDASEKRERLPEIPGSTPQMRHDDVGCTFAPRCAFAEPECRDTPTIATEMEPGHFSRCRRRDVVRSTLERERNRHV